MREEALFINGAYDDVLQQILLIQKTLPEQIMFLQPYSESRIVKLAENPPTVDDPIRLFLSVTTDLNNVHYTAEIVGWDNKRQLTDEKRNVINRLIWTLQPDECGLYEHVGHGKECVNLLHVRRVTEIDSPFPVTRLRLSDEGRPLAGGRTSSGNWVYVDAEPLSS